MLVHSPTIIFTSQRALPLSCIMIKCGHAKQPGVTHMVHWATPCCLYMWQPSASDEEWCTGVGMCSGCNCICLRFRSVHCHLGLLLRFTGLQDGLRQRSYKYWCSHNLTRRLKTTTQLVLISFVNYSQEDKLIGWKPTHHKLANLHLWTHDA